MDSSAARVAEPGRDRRRDIRVPLNVPALIRGRDGAGLASADLLASDISRCGLCLEGNAELQVGGYYAVELCLPDGARLSGTIQVIWSYRGPEGHKFGVKLVQLDIWSGRRIRKYVGACCRLPSEAGFSIEPAEMLLMLLVGLVWLKVMSDFVRF